MQNTHAFKLLHERATVLLETAPAAEASPRIRCEVHHASAGRSLLLRLPPMPDGWVPPAPEQEVAVIVAISTRLWRFPTRVVEARTSAAGADVLLAWPAEAVQEEGRRAPRATVALPVFVPPVPPAHRPIASYSIDLSGSGVQFVYPGALAVETTLPLRLRLPSGEVEVLGQVAWTQPLPTPPEDPLHRAGVSFAGISPAAQQRILSFVRTLTTRRIDDIA